ncbi:MAG: T9SS type A sorting domain-containing protein [Bacteroidales bacterium]|nr:T9SS type A sorting domain-containing protein [Bacteroidales bacterium]
MKKTIFLIVLSSLMVFRVAMGQIIIKILINGEQKPYSPPFIVCTDSCYNVTASVTGGTPPYTYKWNNGGTNDSTVYCFPSETTDPNKEDSIRLWVTDSKNKEGHTEQRLAHSIQTTQEICIVSVDSATNKNVIIWEQSPDAIVRSYHIYKETSVTNEYIKIGTVKKGSMSVFIDTSSNPAKVAAKYKIKALSDCVEALESSSPHKTMHLTINTGIGNTWNLIWENYEGNIGKKKNRIWRGSSSKGLQLIDSVSSSVTTYTDLNPPEGILFYAIEMVPGYKCQPSVKTAKGSYTSSFSNIADNEALIGINNKPNLPVINITPNPCTDELTINVSHFQNVKHLITVYDIHGTAIYQTQSPQSSIIINTRSFPPGLYLTRIQSPNSTTTRKFIKF